MGQGVTATFDNNTALYTGFITDPGDRLQSCSAVAFYNSVTRRGGLYHFPAGSINTDHHSQGVLQQIVNRVQPDRGWIAFGVAAFLNYSTGRYDKNDASATASAAEHEQLRSYVLGLLPMGCRLSRCGSRTGNAVLGWHNGQPVFNVPGDDEVGPITDLNAVAAGNHGAYRVYGHDMN